MVPLLSQISLTACVDVKAWVLLTQFFSQDLPSPGQKYIAEWKKVRGSRHTTLLLYFRLVSQTMACSSSVYLTVAW